MRLIEICEIIETTRQNGKTSILAKAVSESNGVLLVHSNDFGNILKQKYPDLKVAIPNTSIRGISQPILMDHYCIYTLALEMQKEIENLRDEIKQLKGEV